MPEAVPNDDPTPTEEWEAVRRAARGGCYDWYLAALLAPRSVRDDLITLAAYAGEIGRVPSLVSEPMMGAIRLQWWRDALALPPDARTGHPVADRLRRLAVRQSDSQAEQLAIIDAHEVELQPVPPTDAHALAVHFDKQWGSLIRLSGQVLGEGRAGLPPDVTRDAAYAYGLARLVCELAAGLRRGQTLVPPDILARTGCGPNALRLDPAAAAVRKVHAELAHAAKEALATSRRHLAALPSHLAPALWPLATVELYLKAGRAGNPPPAELARAWRMLRTWATARI